MNYKVTERMNMLTVKLQKIKNKLVYVASLIFLVAFFIGCSMPNSENIVSQNKSAVIIEKSTGNLSKEYCIAWSAIQEWTNEDNGNNLRTKEGWEKRITITENLIVSVPSEYQEIGSLYLQIVRDRAELLSQYNYMPLNQLPNNIKQSFIQEHFADQQEANKLINFVQSDCGVN
jgi:hypothetical protein